LRHKRETELAGSRDEAIKIINNAKDTAESNKAKIVAEAAEEARRAKQRANEEIEQSKKEAISGIKGNVADISVKIAEKLIGETLDASAQSELINQYLEKIGGIICLSLLLKNIVKLCLSRSEKAAIRGCISRSGCFNQVIQSTDLQDF
jgi:vacuolar-type H+-ATPase subunit E/Vma4